MKEHIIYFSFFAYLTSLLRKIYEGVTSQWIIARNYFLKSIQHRVTIRLITAYRYVLFHILNRDQLNAHQMNSYITSFSHVRGNATYL